MTWRYGGAPLVATAVIRLERNQPRYWSLPSRIDVGRQRAHAVLEHRAPASRPTRTRCRRCSISLRDASSRRTWGTSSRRAGTLRPARSTTRPRRPCESAPRRLRATAGSSVDSRTPRTRRPGIGVPHARWRERHHSGWLSTICVMRVSPHAGSQRHARAAAPRCVRAQTVGVHREEPLRGRAEDDRVLAAPAMRVRVLVGRRCTTARRRPAGPRRRAGSRVEDCCPAYGPAPSVEHAGAVDRHQDRQPEAHAGLEVVRTVAGRGVHGARAGFELDVVGASTSSKSRSMNGWRTVAPTSAEPVTSPTQRGARARHQRRTRRPRGRAPRRAVRCLRPRARPGRSP